jgi:ATP-dependent helicase/nuclease subunit B
MVHLITGKAGSGKSTRILDLISESDSKSEIIVIVPDQFSFEFERNLYNRLGLARFNGGNINVCGFGKLADIIVETTGNLHKRVASDEIKSILMYRTLKRLLLTNQLKFYNRQAGKNKFRKLAVKMVKELSDNGITAENLTNKFILNADENDAQKTSLTQKMSDIAIIASNYINLFLSCGYKDDTTAYFEAATNAENENYFSGKTIFIDGFSGFTAGEFAIIESIIKSCKDLFITLTYARESFLTTELSLFYPTEITKSKIITSCCTENIDYEEVFLSNSYRFSSDALAFYSENVLIFSDKKYCGKNETVKIFECVDYYDEAKSCAALIHKLCVSDKIYRFSDIVIAVNDISTYSGIISGTFSRFHIPVFIDEKLPLSHQSITVFFLSFLRIACLKNAETDDYIKLLKTGFFKYRDNGGNITEINESVIYEFDDYCYKNDIRGAHFFDKFDDENFENIRSILRKKADDFRNVSEGKSGKVIVRNLAKIVSEFEIPTRLSNFDAKEPEALFLQREMTGAWNLICHVIEKIHECLSDDEIITLNEFYELVESAIGEQTMSAPPQTLDSVTVVPAASARLNNPKCIIILGANADVIPAAPSRNSLLSDTDITLLRDLGIKISGNDFEKISEERFAIYNICSSPCERLYLFYATSESTGKILEPSEIVDNAVSAFGNSVLFHSFNIARENFCRTPDISYMEYMDSVYENSDFVFTLKKALSAKAEFTDRIKVKTRDMNISTALSESLYTNTLKLSATSFEDYCKCPFLFFSKTSLSLKTRQKNELNALLKGNIVHEILSRITVDIIDNKLSSDRLDDAYKTVKKHMEELSDDEKFCGKKRFRTALFEAEFEKLYSVLCAVTKNILEEFSVSDFKVSKTEFRFGFNNKKDEEPAFKIKLNNGRTAIFRGAIDRVDTYKNYLRIVDYKTGSKDFDYKSMVDGIGLQPLIYMFAITDENAGKYRGFSPAGTLFFITLDPQPEETDREETTVSKLKRPVGAVIANVDVIMAMEPIGDNEKGKYIPVDFNKPKNGERVISAYSSVLTADEFESIKVYFTEILNDISNKIYSGKFAPEPIQSRRYSQNDDNENADNESKDDLPCKYCDLSSVCGNYPPVKHFRYFSARDKRVGKEILLSKTNLD